MALLDSKKSMALGVLLLAVGLLFEKQISDMGGEYAYYVVLFLGVVLTACGFYSRANGNDDAHLSESELRDKIILHTLARMTNADFNIMQVEVDSVQSTYKEITGQDVSSKDIRVASLGELYEEKPFCTYLETQQARISTANKIKVMTALSQIMKSDGVVNPLEVEFFNKVGQCLNIKAADMIEL